MPELGTDRPSLVDIVSRFGNGDDDFRNDIVEVLAQSTPLVEDGMAVECNNGTKHATTVRTGLPEPTLRRYNQRVTPTKSETAMVEDVTAMMESYGEVDVSLANLNNNSAQWRLTENEAFIQGFGHKVENLTFYGSTDASPESFMGLAPRFNDSTVASGDQIVNGGGVGSDNTSIWFVTWSPRVCHWIYPKGSVAGLQFKDLGEQTSETSSGLMQVYRDHYKWDIGLTVRDWRGIARVANIDVSNLTKDASGSSADIIDLMMDAETRLHRSATDGGMTCIYVNRTVMSYLKRQALNRSNTYLYFADLLGQNSDGGRPVAMRKQLYFGENPVKQADALLSTEAAITFS